MFSQSFAFHLSFQFLFDFFFNIFINLSEELPNEFPDGRQKAANEETLLSALGGISYDWKLPKEVSVLKDRK